MNEVLSPKMQAFAGLRGGEEAIRYSLYHAKDFAAGALQGPYSFFNVPVGAQDPDTGVAATSEDTNMDAASLLTAPNRFMVTKICVPIGVATATLIPVGSAVAPGTESYKDDVARLVWRGLFTFRLLNKEYLRLAPLGLLGAGMGVWGAVSAATTNSTLNITNALVNNGAPSHNEGYKVILPLETQTTFQAQIGFPKAALTTQAAVRIIVALHGVMYRPEQ
jgi:hypothetical protein